MEYVYQNMQLMGASETKALPDHKFYLCEFCQFGWV